jgi:predicted permease
MGTRLRSLLRALTARREFEEGMADEVRFHIAQYAEDLVRSGVSPQEAARRARIEFGNIDNVTSDCREARGLRLIDELEHDVRYAFRLMRKTPGVTACALATLAICLGANLTIFAVVDAVLLRPLPFPNPDRLVRVFNTYPKAGVPDDGSSTTNYYERRGKISAFSSLSLYRDDAVILGDAGSTTREFVKRVSPEFFSTLGIAPVLGRSFTEAETTFQTNHVVILTDAYWRQRFTADPQVIGRTLRVDGAAVMIVGVLPPHFTFLSSKAQLYFPLASNPDERGPGGRHSGSSSNIVARLKPGVTLADAQSQIDAHNAAMEKTNSQAALLADTGFRSLVVPLHADHVASIRPTLVLVQAGVLSLLLIGAVNVANLLLIRASGRVKELAVRQALGADRRHVVTEIVVETTALTVIGGVLGLAVGAAGIRLLAALGTTRLPLGAQIVFDARAAAVAIAAAIAVGVAIALPIAWYHLRGLPGNALKSEARGATPSRAAQRMRHAFLVTQIALAFVLLAGAGLLGLSLKQVMAVSPGFRPESVLSGQVSLPWSNYPDGPARLTFIDRLTEALGGQPGVRAVGVATNIPLSGNSNRSSATVKGYRLRPGESLHGIYSYAVAGDYFAAMGFPLVEGRFLDASDVRRLAHVCVVDQDFARRYWPHGGAIGQLLFSGSIEGDDSEAFRIVGVVGAVKQAGLAENEALGAVYYPYAERFDSAIYVVTRTSVPPDSFGLTLQRVVRRIDAELPVNNVRSMETRIADSLTTRRSPAVLAGVFSSIALLLTAIGTYGVLSYAVRQRRREIALRMAVGARPGQIRRQFVSLALRLMASGMALGLIGAWITGRAMQTVLFHVPPVHVTVLLSTAVVLGVVSVAACLLPSHRAARISPMEALAEE